MAGVAFDLELVDGMDVLWLDGEDGEVDKVADDDEDAVVEDEEMLREQCSIEYIVAVSSL